MIVGATGLPSIRLEFLAFLITNCGIFLDDYSGTKPSESIWRSIFGHIWMLFQEQVGEAWLVSMFTPKG